MENNIEIKKGTHIFYLGNMLHTLYTYIGTHPKYYYYNNELFNEGEKIRESKIIQIVYDKHSKAVYNCKGFTVHSESFGKTWFLTKEEAEKEYNRRIETYKIAKEKAEQGKCVGGMFCTVATTGYSKEERISECTDCWWKRLLYPQFFC